MVPHQAPENARFMYLFPVILGFLSRRMNFYEDFSFVGDKNFKTDPVKYTALT